MTLRALRTPGHTGESTSYLLDGKALLTGDTLFLSAVGRPDLEASPEGAREKARILHGSLRRVLGLEPGTLVLPGHTSEPVPFDGKPVAAPLPEVRENTPLLAEDEDVFGEPEGDPTELEAGANRCAAG